MKKRECGYFESTRKDDNYPERCEKLFRLFYDTRERLIENNDIKTE